MEMTLLTFLGPEKEGVMRDGHNPTPTVWRKRAQSGGNPARYMAKQVTRNVAGWGDHGWKARAFWNGCQAGAQQCCASTTRGWGLLVGTTKGALGAGFGARRRATLGELALPLTKYGYSYVNRPAKRPGQLPYPGGSFLVHRRRHPDVAHGRDVAGEPQRRRVAAAG